MVLLSVSFGMVLIAETDAVVALVTMEVLKGYAGVVLTAVFLPLIYALAIDFR
jgi:hypothetical protein